MVALGSRRGVYIFYSQETVQWLEENPQPSLILMDIELSDGRCFHIFDLCDIDCPVIFCTPYDQYALEAFNANGIQYLLKPISRNHLFGALQRFNRFTTPKRGPRS